MILLKHIRPSIVFFLLICFRHGFCIWLELMHCNTSFRPFFHVAGIILMTGILLPMIIWSLWTLSFSLTGFIKSWSLQLFQPPLSSRHHGSTSRFWNVFGFFRRRACKAKENLYWLSSTAVSTTISKAFSSGASSHSLSFDTDGLSIVLDNSATCHICNNKSLFTSEITYLDVTTDIGVSTAGGTVRPDGVGTISIRWNYDDGKSHPMSIDDVLYFPSSPVNIIGITKLEN